LPAEFARIAKFSPVGWRIVIVGDHNEALIWDFIKDQKSHIPLGNQRNINNAEFSPDGKKLITTSGDETAKIWSIDTRALLSSLEDQRPIGKVKFSPDGERVATLSRGIVNIWDVNTGKKLASLKNKVVVNSIDFSPDGERLLTANSDKTVITWDLSYTGLSSSELNEFVENRGPFHLVNGVLVPRLNF